MLLQTTWIIIWRMNPPHIWHQELIKISFRENDITLVFIGTKKVKDNKNPFSFEQIKKWLSLVFETSKPHIFIDEIKDNPSDKNWVLSLIKKIEDKKTGKNIVFYWWDLENDYAINCIKSYSELFQGYNISYEELDRKEMKVNIAGQDIDISGTNVRLALKGKNNEVIDKMVDKRIIMDLFFEYNKLK